jgi:predicted dehydrogenase
MKTTLLLILVIVVTELTGTAQPLRVVVAGLTHDHAHGIMNQYKNGEVIILGIAESNQELIERYKSRYQLHDSLFIRKDVGTFLKERKPDAVLAYGSTFDHLAIVEMCAPLKISVMVEKPLAISNQHANRIAALAKQHNIHVLTNYETTWYPTNQQIFSMVNDKNDLGPVRKMVVHDGHGGPKEIGCSKEFLAWLTDPDLNGGGALFDFGCYGANLMTWMMKGKMPISVSATVKRIKPAIYPKVDDEATIVVEYEDATGIIEASWNWPFGIKDFEVFGTSGYLHALNGNTLQQRKTDKYEEVSVVQPKYTSNLTYLADVLRGKTKPENDLSSLSNNLIVVKILDAARQSAKEGKKIMLK